MYQGEASGKAGINTDRGQANDEKGTNGKSTNQHAVGIQGQPRGSYETACVYRSSKLVQYLLWKVALLVP